MTTQKRKYDISDPKQQISLMFSKRLLKETNDYVSELNVSRARFIGACIRYCLKQISSKNLKWEDLDYRPEDS